MKTKLFFGLFLVFMVQQSVAAQKIDAQPGQWEISSQMQMQGLPIKVPPIKQMQCITEKDLVPKGVHQQKNCAASDIKITDNQVSWSMKCQTKAGEVTGKGKVTYQKTSFTGSFQMEMPGPQGKMVMTNDLKGRYIGRCQ
jgi:hypothetical protein